MKSENDIMKEAIKDAELYTSLAEECAKEEDYKFYYASLLSCYKTIYNIAKETDEDFSRGYLRFLCKNKKMGLTYREVAKVLQIHISEVYSAIFEDEA